MSPLLLGFLVMLSVGALGFALAPAFSGGGRKSRRRAAFTVERNEARQVANASRARDSRRRTVQDALKAQNEALNARRRKASLKSRLFQAGVATPPKVFIRNSVILGVVLFLVCILLQVPLLFSAVFAVAGAYVLPSAYLARKRKRYQNAYLDELPNAVEAIVRGVRSGLPLNDSIRLVSKEVREPVRSEFQRVLDQQAVGKSMHEAVDVLYDRVPLPEVNFFIVVITVQQQSGGNLSEALGNLATVLRARKKMKAKVQALSSEAKASAIIIGALPVFVAGAVSVLSPTYLGPLFTTNAGLVALAIAFLLLVMGVFIMNRMIQFEY